MKSRNRDARKKLKSKRNESSSSLSRSAEMTRSPKGELKRAKGTEKPKHRVPLNRQKINDYLYDYFSNHGMADFPHEKRLQLAHFCELLMAQQETQNLTRIRQLRDIAIKHFIDSLFITKLIDLPFPLLDIGTGPGFPGIPLKICYPQEKIILAEGVKKRVDFLRLVKEQLKLEQLEIIGRNIDKSFSYPVKGVITRALEDCSTTLGRVLGCLQPQGQVILMKGPKCENEIASAVQKWEGSFCLIKNISYEIPQTPHQRRLVVFEKVAGSAP